MPESKTTDSALRNCRVLDLTEGGFNWCGKVLADLGADVIKVEPPGGSPTRDRGPFYKDEPHRERSLFWYSYCMNKRGITLDLENPHGQEQLRKLAAKADIVIESFTPRHITRLGLGYESINRINPGIIMTSITPFGQSGPYAHYKATDLIGWSMGGMQYVGGDDDRPPARISVPQAELQAGAQAAAGSMIAYWHRQQTGEGQHVDVSMQIAVIWTLMNATPLPPLHKINAERGGAYLRLGPVTVRAVFPCKDGYVSALVIGGLLGGSSTKALVVWMDEEGSAPDFMKERDWTAWVIPEVFAQGEEGERDIRAVEKHVTDFFTTKTKAEIFDRALTSRILVAPCNTVQDIWENPQLKARDFWTDVPHPELDAVLTYPGPYIKLSETPIRARRRAPLIGEHNDEVFGEWLVPSAETSRPAQESSSDARPSSFGTPSKMPLEGVKVLDFTWVGVGPITMKYFADHGAEVIHVESVTRPDVLRSVMPFKDAEPGFNRSQFPANYNTSKYGLGLNMAKPEARELVNRLITEWRPDIIAESFTPKAMRNWGLDYESVKKLRPDIVYFSTCQQGQTGPHAMYAGYGQLAAALAGYYNITGWPDREPAAPYGAYSDFINPPNALAAVISALEFRRRTGKGQHLDLSQFECATQFMTPAIMDFVINGRIMGRKGNSDDEYAPHGVYPCKEEERPLTGMGQSWCAIEVSSDEEWKALCSAMGSPAWANDVRFSTFEGRMGHEEEIDRLLGEWTAQYEAQELMNLLQEAGVPAGAVQSQADLREDPQLQHQGFFQWLDHTECGPMPYDGLQFLLSKTPGKLRMPHALVGEHNEFVVKELLLLSDDEIADLVIKEVLETSF